METRQGGSDDLMPSHGTRYMYNKGCHCRPCTIANRIYVRNYKRGKEGTTGWTLIDPEQEQYEQEILAQAVSDEDTNNSERTA